ncbi:CdaR family protein [Flavonifractor hominis]|uniref:CdaR family protein n=1 Tax=Flavonifractor hominis TaxID=3133178 RepID=A0ABV1EKR8_9FIRM
MPKKLTDSKWFYVAVSLLLAFILWVYVGKEANPITTDKINDIPVEFSGLEKLEERGLMLSDGSEQSVSFFVRARRDVISNLLQGESSITVDVSNITEAGEYSLSVMGQKINFPRSVSSDSLELLYTTPERIEFTVSRWVQKEIEVQAEFTGSVVDGYQVGDFSLAPQTVTISGPEELVNQVDYARVTVSQTDLSETYSKDTPYTLVGFNGEVIAAEGIETDPETVLVTLPVVKLKEVPLTVELVPGGGVTDIDTQVDVTIEPETITVSGSEEDLEGLKEVKLGSIELYKIFGTDTFQKTIQLSPELTNVSGITEATVTVTIKDLAVRTLEVSDIDLINVPDGYTADTVTKTLSVQIRGTEEAVDSVIPSQLRIVADLSDVTMATGNQTVPVKVYLDGSSEVGVVGDYKIVVSISR